MHLFLVRWKEVFQKKQRWHYQKILLSCQSNFFLICKLVLVIAWFRAKLTINLTRGKFSSLSYHESNLSLIARETIRLLINHRLIPVAMQSKSISLEQICYKRSQGIVVTSLHCLLFSTSKSKYLQRKVLPV